MKNFGFLNIEETINVKIRGKNYPVVKTGRGMPCLLICLGTPTFRTLSKNFGNHFEIYSSDMYWIAQNALDNPDAVTLDIILDDIKALIDALGLKQFIMLGHSAYGIIALEFAKKYPNVASAILMIGTPVNANDKVAEQHNLIFQQQAEPQRKLIDQQRRAEIEKEDLTKLSPSERWVKEYIYRDAPRYWHVPDFDCGGLWKGISLDRLLVRLFTDILPPVDVLKNLEQVSEPIFLAAGMSDYDCCPWLWEKVPNLPKNFTINIFKQSGHWPHYEEPIFFDTKVKEWANRL